MHHHKNQRPDRAYTDNFYHNGVSLPYTTGGKETPLFHVQCYAIERHFQEVKYYSPNGNCILLDDGDYCVCPQLISYSLLCKWFRIAVLPADKELYAELYHTEDMRRCSVCGAPFASSSNRAIYCPDCRKRITRRQTAERMRKMRGNVTR